MPGSGLTAQPLTHTRPMSIWNEGRRRSHNDNLPTADREGICSARGLTPTGKPLAERPRFAVISEASHVYSFDLLMNHVQDPVVSVRDLAATASLCSPALNVGRRAPGSACLSSNTASVDPFSLARAHSADTFTWAVVQRKNGERSNLVRIPENKRAFIPGRS